MIKKFDAHRAYIAFYDKNFINDPEIDELYNIQKSIENHIEQQVYDRKMITGMHYNLGEFMEKFPEFPLQNFAHAIRLSLLDANIPFSMCEINTFGDICLRIRFEW